MDNWTPSRIETMFYSSQNGFGPRGLMDEYVELAEYMNNGWIAVETLEYEPVDLDEIKHSNPALYKAASLGTGGEQHTILKLIAWRWLISKGATNPQFEVPSAHGIADVSAGDIQTVVECGDSNPDKLFLTFSQNTQMQLVLIPFSEDLGHVLYIFRVTHAGAQAFMDRKERHWWIDNPLRSIGL